MHVETQEMPEIRSLPPNRPMVGWAKYTRLG